MNVYVQYVYNLIDYYYHWHYHHYHYYHHH